MSRRFKLAEDKTLKAVCEGIKAGMTYRAVAKRVGVCEQVFHFWRKRGREDIAAEKDTPFAKFQTQVAEAQAELEFSLLTTIVKAAPKDWRAAKWMLTRPNRSGYKDKPMDLTDGQVPPSLADELEALRAKLTPDQQDALDDILDVLDEMPAKDPAVSEGTADEEPPAAEGDTE